MLPIVTAQEMQSIDRTAIQQLGIPGMVLMERAGLQAAHRALALLGPKPGPTVVLCGKGNNGGDGFVIARELWNRRLPVVVFVFAKSGDLAGDAAANHDIAVRLGICVEYEPDLQNLREALNSTALVVDALLGTGLTGAVRQPLAGVIEAVNASMAPVLSVDIPSGLHTDTGQVQGACIRATATVTLGAYKRGLLLHPGRELAGALSLGDIGIPHSVFDQHEIPCVMPEREDIRALLPGLTPTRHKSSAGKVLLVAGSTGMTGAAALAGMASLRTGAGLAVLGTPASCNAILEEKVTEVMTLPLPETGSGNLAPAAVAALREQLAWADAVAIGPGIGRHPETIAFIHALLPAIDRPLVLDADALFAVAEDRTILKKLKQPVVVTPHGGEFARLMGLSIDMVLADRIEAARSAAGELGVTVVLKGAPTITAGPGGAASVNPTGNPGLATGGTGDVLTGVIGGLLAQGMETVAAAVAGVYIHGLAGDLAADACGMRGMTAGDVLDRLPDALLNLESPQPGTPV